MRLPWERASRPISAGRLGMRGHHFEQCAAVRCLCGVLAWRCARAWKSAQRLYLPINGLLASKGGLPGSLLRSVSARNTAAGIAVPRHDKQSSNAHRHPPPAFNCLFGYILIVVVAVALWQWACTRSASRVVDGVEITMKPCAQPPAASWCSSPWVYVFAPACARARGTRCRSRAHLAWIMSTAPVPPRAIPGREARHQRPAVKALARAIQRSRAARLGRGGRICRPSSYPCWASASFTC